MQTVALNVVAYNQFNNCKQRTNINVHFFIICSKSNYMYIVKTMWQSAKVMTYRLECLPTFWITKIVWTSTEPSLLLTLQVYCPESPNCTFFSKRSFALSVVIFGADGGPLQVTVGAGNPNALQVSVLFLPRYPSSNRFGLARIFGGTVVKMIDIQVRLFKRRSKP